MVLAATVMAASCASCDKTTAEVPGATNEMAADGGGPSVSVPPDAIPPDVAAIPQDTRTTVDAGSSGAADKNTNGPLADAATGLLSDTFRSNDAGQGPGASACPTDGTPCRILPMGDSNTEGFTAVAGLTGAYRMALFHDALMNKKNITFVGSLMNGPATVDGVPFARNHLGVGGYTIASGTSKNGITHTGIANFVPDRVASAKPHIILLMIGTNDMTDTSFDLPNAPARLGALIDGIFAAAPNALLVVAQILPAQDEGINALIRNYNAAIPGLVKARADAGKKIRFVDMYGGFAANPAYKTTYYTNNLHPNVVGYAKVADIWYAGIADVLK